MSHVNIHLQLRCYESMVKSFDQLIQIPGIKEIIEASNYGRGLVLNIKACKHEIEKIERENIKDQTERMK